VKTYLYMTSFITNLDDDSTYTINSALSEIEKNGYVVLDNFLHNQIIEELAAIVKSKWLNQEMISAKTGKTGLSNQSVRGDYIAWLDNQESNPALQAYIRNMEMLRLSLNTQLFLNVQELETHFAVYPIGASYQKHLDQFKHGDKSQTQHRQISAILYLNQQWQTHYGGALRLYTNNDTYIDVMPEAGRIVLFLSALFWHEVLPAQRERMSITGWFRTRANSIV
jgi:SM-20-related protein